MQLINFIHQIATTLGDFFDLENGFLRYEMESFKQGPKIRGAGQRPKQKLFSIRPLGWTSCNQFGNKSRYP